MIIFKLLCILVLSNYVICFLRHNKHDHNTKIPSPLVIVPGDGGSRGYAKVKHLSFTFTILIWVNYLYMLLPSALTSYFKLIYDPKTHTTRDMDGVEVFFPGWGSTLTIEDLDDRKHSTTTYFHQLVQELMKDKFYQRNRTLRGAPYDFRKAPNENQFFVNDLRLLIEDTYNQSGNERVVLVGHSMGSLFSMNFLNKMSLSWKRKFIRSFVSVSGPLAGAVKALILETTGDAFHSPRDPYYFREMERSFPSTTFLLPKYSVFGDTPIIITPRRNYSANDYAMVFKDMNFPLGELMYDDTKNLVEGTQTPEGIDELYCIHGYGLNTAEQLVFTDFPDKLPKLKFGDGDGTVNIQSLELCKKWNNVNYYAIKGVEHMAIVKNPQFITKLMGILYEPPNVRC